MNEHKFEVAISLIKSELEKESVKHPEWPTDPVHALSIIGEGFGELTKDVLQMCYEPGHSSKRSVRVEAVQTAAKAVRFIMSLDEYEYRKDKQHEQ